MCAPRLCAVYSGGVITLAVPCSCGNYGDVGGGLSGTEMVCAV